MNGTTGNGGMMIDDHAFWTFQVDIFNNITDCQLFQSDDDDNIGEMDSRMDDEFAAMIRMVFDFAYLIPSESLKVVMFRTLIK